MFTGIVEQTGEIVSLEQRSGGVLRLTVHAPGLAGKLREGDSMAVSGVCLTALDVEPELFHADLAAETVAKTSLAELQPGSSVNLELPTAAGSPLGGHVVQGHVDGTGLLRALEAVDASVSQETTDWWLRIEVPEAVVRYMVPKGSVAIEGISLTIADFQPETRLLTIAILPLTYWRTNLHTLSAGSKVNVEADVLLKFAEQQAQWKPSFDLTEEYLIANGY